jgi:tetratricopeptide (TPR) repeat protein
MLVLGQSSNDPVMLQFAHFGYMDLASCRQDAALARQHAGRVAEIAAKHEGPYLRVFALSCRALASSIAGDFEAAAKTYTQALALVRSAKAAMEFETEILASLAECQRSLQQFEEARETAREAIDISRQRSTRLPECRALITLAAVTLDVFGAQHVAQAQDLLSEAEALVRLTGASIYETSLMRERERLNLLQTQTPEAAVTGAGQAA